MIHLTLTDTELLDILIALGARTPGTRSGLSGNDRLALRAKLEAYLSEMEEEK